MRMDRSQALRAEDLVNATPESELADLIYAYGQERFSRRIARQIVRRRPLTVTTDLAEAVAAAIPRRAWPKGIHPATRTFQALRIATNSELDALKQALPDAVGSLREGGRLCVITFHSLEDRILKHTYLRLSRGCTCPPGSPTCSCGGHRLIRILTRRPVTPTKTEVAVNPRARSAKLRVAERLSGANGSPATKILDAPEAGHHSADPTLPFDPPDDFSPAPGLRRAYPDRDAGDSRPPRGTRTP